MIQVYILFQCIIFGEQYPSVFDQNVITYLQEKYNHSENTISNVFFGERSSFILNPNFSKNNFIFPITQEISYIKVFFYIKTIFSEHFEKIDMAIGEVLRRRLCFVFHFHLHVTR